MTPGECVVGILVLWIALGGVMVSVVAAVHLTRLWRSRRDR